MAGKCNVCRIGQTKYRCPACSTPYCSVACNTSHRASCEGRAAASTTAASTEHFSSCDSIIDAERSDGDVVLTDAQLALIGSTASLRAALRDRRLQAIIRSVDAAPDRRKALEHARHTGGADFIAFLDEMLLAIGACTRQDDGSVIFAS